MIEHYSKRILPLSFRIRGDLLLTTTFRLYISNDSASDYVGDYSTEGMRAEANQNSELSCLLSLAVFRLREPSHPLCFRQQK